MWLAKKVGLNPGLVRTPTEGFILLEVVDRKKWSAYHSGELNGKCVNLQHHSTQIIIDDNIDICVECARGGILPYHIRSHYKAKKYVNADLASAELRHTSSSCFAEAVKVIIEDAETGKLFEKLDAIERGRKW